MAGILYGVSPIGFGHAARAVAIGLKLRERSLEPVFATGGPAVAFLESYGFKVQDIVREPVPAESGGEMKGATLWYLRYALGYRSTRRKMAELVAKLSPKLIVGDGRAGTDGGRAARKILEKTAPAVVAHQNVKLAVRAESQDAAIVIAAQRLIRISLISAQLDQVAIEDQRALVPKVSIDAIRQRLKDVSKIR